MENKEITHWTPEEELHYNFFLIYKANQLLTLKNKNGGFYVEMAAFINSRNKIQCRSHHEKMIARFKNYQNTQKRELQLMNLKSFYKDHLELRLLDSKHLLKEIEYHLTKKVNKDLISKEFYCLFQEKVMENLTLLNFQNSNSMLKNETIIKEKNRQEKLIFYKNDSKLPNYEFSSLLDPTEEQEFQNFIYFSDDSLGNL